MQAPNSEVRACGEGKTAFSRRAVTLLLKFLDSWRAPLRTARELNLVPRSGLGGGPARAASRMVYMLFRT